MRFGALPDSYSRIRQGHRSTLGMLSLTERVSFNSNAWEIALRSPFGENNHPNQQTIPVPDFE